MNAGGAISTGRTSNSSNQSSAGPVIFWWEVDGVVNLVARSVDKTQTLANMSFVCKAWKQHTEPMFKSLREFDPETDCQFRIPKKDAIWSALVYQLNKLEDPSADAHPRDPVKSTRRVMDLLPKLGGPGSFEIFKDNFTVFRGLTEEDWHGLVDKWRGEYPNVAATRVAMLSIAVKTHPAAKEIFSFADLDVLRGESFMHKIKAGFAQAKHFRNDPVLMDGLFHGTFLFKERTKVLAELITDLPTPSTITRWLTDTRLDGMDCHILLDYLLRSDLPKNCAKLVLKSLIKALDRLPETGLLARLSANQKNLVRVCKSDHEELTHLVAMAEAFQTWSPEAKNFLKELRTLKLTPQ